MDGELCTTLEEPYHALVFDREDGLIADELDAEEQDLADTLLPDEFSKFDE